MASLLDTFIHQIVYHKFRQKATYQNEIICKSAKTDFEKSSLEIFLKVFCISSSKTILHVQRVVKARKNRFQAGGERDVSDPRKTERCRRGLIDVLTAISVVSKRLAWNLSWLARQSQSTEGGKTDGQNERDSLNHYRPAKCCCRN
jgi:hypothetical protein